MSSPNASSTEKKTVAVIGLGQVGSRIARTLLNEQLANVVVVSRGPSAENDAFLQVGLCPLSAAAWHLCAIMSVLCIEHA